MRVDFHKYHGNGNDFILIDNRTGFLNDINQKSIKYLCERRFGIGADGLILLNKSTEYDFEMKYYNSDGNESTMCGNGGRCIVKFASMLGLIGNSTQFLAIDGLHEGAIEKSGIVKLKMQDVSSFSEKEGDFIINTGSPHYVKFIEKIDSVDVKTEGKKIRCQPEFEQDGINVNFVESDDGKFKVRTYERGVEDETFSCGTGIVAVALVGSLKNGKEGSIQEVQLETQGGSFVVAFLRENRAFSNIWLIGDAKFVFKGEAELDNFS